MFFLLLTLNFLIEDSIRLVNEFDNDYSFFWNSFSKSHLFIENSSDRTIMYDPAVYCIEKYNPMRKDWDTVYTVADSMLDAIIVYPKKKSMVSICVPQGNGCYRIGWDICVLDDSLRCCEEFCIYHYCYSWGIWKFL